MHQQIRLSVPASSPPSLARVLQVLRDAEINIIAVGGSNIEHGGEFAFAVDHRRQDEAMAVLEKARLRPRLVDVHLCELENKAGSLLECIEALNEQERPEGRLIKDVAVGIPGADGRVQVQVYFERAELDKGAEAS